jgi:hypothetical protein
MTDRRRLMVPVLSGEPGVAEEYRRAVWPDDSEPIVLQGAEVVVRAVVAEEIERTPVDGAEWPHADAFVLLVHFLDQASIGVARRLYHRLRVVRPVPMGVFLFRAADERQFKISCPECGQKLWVLESEVGRRGRCVNCRHPIGIRTPSEFLREMLSLPDSVPVLNVVKGDGPICRGALSNLLARASVGIIPGSAGSREDLLKQATIPIQTSSR